MKLEFFARAGLPRWLLQGHIRVRLALLSAIALSTAACTSGTQEVLPISRGVVRASQVAAVELILQPTAAPSVAALDQRGSGAEGAAGRPFEALIDAAVRDAAVRAGLTGGRPLRLVLDIDHLQVPGTGAALFGKQDRLAGTVYIRDASTGATLGQLYVDVASSNAGIVGVALRGGGTRERLVQAFAERIAEALSGRKAPSR